MRESWVGCVHTFGVANDGFARSEETGDGKGHGDAVIAEAIDLRGVQWRAAGDFHAIFVLGDIATHRAEVVDDGRDAIGFLHAKFAGIADDRGAIGKRGGNRKHRDLIDEVGNFAFENRRALELRAVDFDVADRFAGCLMRRLDDVGAHAIECGDDGGARWVESDIAQGESGAGQCGGGDQPECRAGDVAGHGEVAGLRNLAAGE